MRRSYLALAATLAIMLLWLLPGCDGGMGDRGAQQQGTPNVKNGKITFLRTLGVTSIYEMNADGTGVTRVTDPSVNILQANMSPNGKKIAFIRSDTYDLYVMNADGTSLTRIYGALRRLGTLSFPRTARRLLSHSEEISG